MAKEVNTFCFKNYTFRDEFLSYVHTFLDELSAFTYTFRDELFLKKPSNCFVFLSHGGGRFLVHAFEHLAKIRRGAEAQGVADLLHGVARCGEQGGCFFAKHLLAQAVWCFICHLLDVMVQK